MNNPTYTWGGGGSRVKNHLLGGWSVRHEFDAVPIVETVLAGTTVEDWSGCRSPSRAMRRASQGHRQHNKMVFEPGSFEICGTIYVHPQVMKELCAVLNRQMDTMIAEALFGEERKS